MVHQFTKGDEVVYNRPLSQWNKIEGTVEKSGGGVTWLKLTKLNKFSLEQGYRVGTIVVLIPDYLELINQELQYDPNQQLDLETDI